MNQVLSRQVILPQSFLPLRWVQSSQQFINRSVSKLKQIFLDDSHRSWLSKKSDYLR